MVSRRPPARNVNPCATPKPLEDICRHPQTCVNRETWALDNERLAPLGERDYVIIKALYVAQMNEHQETREGATESAVASSSQGRSIRPPSTTDDLGSTARIVCSVW